MASREILHQKAGDHDGGGGGGGRGGDGQQRQIDMIMATLATWIAAAPGERRVTIAQRHAGAVVVTLERRAALHGEDLVDALGQAATLAAMGGL